MKAIHLIAMFLVLIGALNWGLVGLFHFDLVEFLLGWGFLARVIYIAIGVSAIWTIIFSKCLHEKCGCSK